MPYSKYTYESFLMPIPWFDFPIDLMTFSAINDENFFPQKEIKIASEER